MEQLAKKSKAILIAGSLMGSEKTSSFVSLKDFLLAWKTHFQGIVFHDLHLAAVGSSSNNSLFAIKYNTFSFFNLQFITPNEGNKEVKGLFSITLLL